jgi:microcystin degradation protein MlrC
MTSFDCQTINMYPTTIEPMKTFICKLRKLEQQEDVLSISIVHGFPWGDVNDIGTKVIVVTNNNKDKANQLAQKLGSELIELRGKTMAPFFSIDESLNIAEKLNSTPIVLADFSDNTGGGAPGDSTFILKRILERKIKNVAIGVIYDPMAVEIAAAAGIGNKLPLRIGGKTSPESGLPIDLFVEVISIKDDLTINFAQSTAHYGKTVAVHADEIDLIISSLRLQVYSTECFSIMGIDPKSRNILVVKSAVHFRTSFEKISNKIIIVSTTGALCPDFQSVPYKNIKRPIWPIDEIL